MSCYTHTWKAIDYIGITENLSKHFEMAKYAYWYWLGQRTPVDSTDSACPLEKSKYSYTWKCKSSQAFNTLGSV